MIYETIITTVNPDQSVHIAPMGIKRIDNVVIISPFKPSTTLSNLEEYKQATINFTDDVRIFAGCLTGHYTWPTEKTVKINGQRLTDALCHIEVTVKDMEDDELRPDFKCEIVYQEIHAPFKGFNRAQSAVIEASILVSRLNRLPIEKVNREIEYLKIAIDKTAGDKELEAWGWLMERILLHRQQSKASEDMV